MNEPPNNSSPYQTWPKHWHWLIIAALIGWASYHAVGSYYGGRSLADSFQRGSVVLIAMLLFIGWWVVLLKTRKPRKLKYRIKQSTTEYVTVSIPVAESAPAELPAEKPNDNPYVSPIAEIK
jgi:hypothetical protein